MHPTLETLLEIQDLKSQRKELEAASGERQVEEDVFQMSIGEALAKLDEKIGELENSLPPQVRSRYRRLEKRTPRIVAPVIGGICYGCFVAIPTAVASDAERNDEIRTCDNCGRFLYLFD
ncbi:MAG TPA: C4-type zinc ribbon domain-containing protein [Longimicrobiaceae bacterium]|jgi:predicted  nucleic acid-binding Zn-ribbon protein|nr:C4-type zinc ribbon domain-containing protein [Longimicrobiaceae bacterium]